MQRNLVRIMLSPDYWSTYFICLRVGMSNTEVLVARMMNEDLALFLYAIKPTLFSDGKNVDEVDVATRVCSYYPLH